MQLISYTVFNVDLILNIGILLKTWEICSLCIFYASTFLLILKYIIPFTVQGYVSDFAIVIPVHIAVITAIHVPYSYYALLLWPKLLVIVVICCHTSFVMPLPMYWNRWHLHYLEALFEFWMVLVQIIGWYVWGMFWARPVTVGLPGLAQKYP